MTFQATALVFTAIYIAIVVVRFRRSTSVLIGGLAAIGLYTLVELDRGGVTLAQLGLGVPASWWPTLGFALVWLGLMYAYSPAADWLASRFFDKPPTLESFRAIQESRVKLVAGIVVAWLLGGILEELVFRGIVLQSVKSLLSASPVAPAATGFAVGVAAAGAGLMHLYQGPRAAVIVTQLSVLFGILFVVSGYNLWAVILCHGLYDTVAFIRFANKKSKYSDLDSGQSSRSQRRA